MACCILTAVIMNQLIKICDTLDISFLQIKYNDDDKEEGPCAPADVQRETTSRTCHITISGMTCSACTFGIVEKLEELDGVHRAAVSLAIGRATVSYDTLAILPVNLLEAVNEMGYSATLEKQTASDMLGRLNQSTELLELKRALSSASICSTAIMGLEHIPSMSRNSAPAAAICRVSAYIALFLAAKVQVIDAWPIHMRAWSRYGKLGITMDTLLSSSLILGVGLALLQTSLARYRQSLAYASSGSFLTIVIIGGRYLEAVLKRENNRNLAALYELQVEKGSYEVVSSGVHVPGSLLRKGDEVFIQASATIPCDCYILEGSSAINASTITGEALPIVNNVGDLLLAGTKNLSSRLRVAVALKQTESSLTKVIEGVTAASEQQLDGMESLDVLLRYFVSGVVSLATAAFAKILFTQAYSLSTESFVAACERAATILAAACPCGIGLAIPSAAMAGIDAAHSHGILLGGGIRTMRALSSITHVIMDKTGTLTQGRLAVVDHEFSGDLKINRHLCYRLLAAAEFEEARVHPVANAVFKWALFNAQPDQSARSVPETRNTKRLLGMGVSCEVKGHSDEWIAVHIGHADFLLENGITIPHYHEGKSLADSKVHFAFIRTYAGSLVVRDAIRSDASSVVAKLVESGRQVTMLTGDNDTEARRISNTLRIEVLASRALPQDKVTHVRDLQARGHHVAMVGDGMNDAPAQAAADVGVSISRTQGYLVGSGNVVIVSGDLNALVLLFTIARKVVKQARVNVSWALVYNVFALSLALGFWDGYGLRITPSIAGTLMAMSSLMVLGMSLSLRWSLQGLDR